MDKSSSTKRLYSDVVKGQTCSEPSPTWLREDEEEAVKRAIEESVKVTISSSRRIIFHFTDFLA